MDDRWSIIVTCPLNGTMGAYHCTCSRRETEELASFMSQFMPFHTVRVDSYENARSIPVPLAEYDENASRSQ